MDLSLRLAASRSDRIIALARLPLGAVIFLAIWLDSTQPTRVPALMYLLLAGYLSFSLVAAGLLFRPPARPTLVLIAHFVDLGVFAFLVYTTEGPTSPFFLLFTFSIVSAAFRWRWQGALWTSLAVLALQLLAAAVFVGFVPDTVFEIDRFLIRSTHVVVIGGMLAYFAYHRDRIADEVSRLHPSPMGPWDETERDEFVKKSLELLSKLFETPALAIVIDDPEEPRAGVHVWREGTLATERIAPEVFDRIVSRPSDAAIWIESSADWAALTRPKVETPADGTKLETLLQGISDPFPILSIPVPSDYGRFRLFLVGPKARRWDAMLMADLLAVRIGRGLDRIETAAVQGRVRLAEERLSLARDLHDGILQTLAGTALQLENLARQAETDPETVPARIRTLQDWLIAEQRELRLLIGRLRPGRRSAAEPARSEDRHFQDLARGLWRQWNMKVSVRLLSGVSGVPPELNHDLHQIIREAAANAARHGGASELDVNIGAAADGLIVTLRDNGTGLPSGDEARLAAGPRSLRERVAKLGGALSINSSARGLRLEIRLPSVQRGAA